MWNCSECAGLPEEHWHSYKAVQSMNGAHTHNCACFHLHPQVEFTFFPMKPLTLMCNCALELTLRGMSQFWHSRQPLRTTGSGAGKRTSTPALETDYTRQTTTQRGPVSCLQCACPSKPSGCLPHGRTNRVSAGDLIISPGGSGFTMNLHSTVLVTWPCPQDYCGEWFNS